VIVAQSNQIKEFPQALLPNSAPRLSTIDLANNSMVMMPPELGLSTSLARISLAGNPLRSIRREVLQGSCENLKKFLRSRLQGAASEEAAMSTQAAQDDLAVELRAAAASHKLSFEGKGMTTLPVLPKGLRVLRLSGNSLTMEALGGALGFRKTVASEHGSEIFLLSASRNALGYGYGLDAVLNCMALQLPALQELDLSFNELIEENVQDTHLRVNEAAPSALTRLDLSGNRLTQLPPRLFSGGYPSLQELRLRRNCISSLNGAGSEATPPLVSIDLEENCLSTVPAWLPSALPQLHVLLLGNNNISPTLPPEWGFWSSLQVVSLVGNPLKGIRQSIIVKGWPAISAWLRDRLPEGADSLVAIPPIVSPASPSHRSQTTPSDEWQASAFPSNPAAAAAAAPGHGGTTAATAPPPGKAVAARAAAGGAAPDTNALEARLGKLRAEVCSLEDELSSPGISRSKQSAVNHSLRMKRAELLKAEREQRRLSADEHGGE